MAQSGKYTLPYEICTGLASNYDAQSLYMMRKANKSWRALVDDRSNTFPGPIAMHYFNPSQLCKDNGWTPPARMIHNLMQAAAEDGLSMDMNVFREIVITQYLLQRLQSREPPFREIRLRTVVDVLVQTISPKLTASHSIVKRMLTMLDIPVEQLGRNIAKEIPKLQEKWRVFHSNKLCIGHVLQILCLGRIKRTHESCSQRTARLARLRFNSY